MVMKVSMVDAVAALCCCTCDFIRWLGDADITSRRLIEDILKEEEDHADELNDLFTG